MADFKFEIIKQIAVLGKKNSWTKELNLISWNDREPKYDIRDWDENHQKMSKGLTFDKMK